MEDNKQKLTEVKNFYGGIYFDRCQMTDIKFQTIVQGDMHVQATEDEERDEAFAAQEEQDVPPQLQTQEAEALLKKLAAAGIVDAGWQPLGLSGSEKGVLASILADRLEIGNHWKFFGRLWDMNPETLRTAFNKGMDQHRTADFMERVKNALKG